ncbi:MAG: hypothetical protein AB1742_16080 [bacterium]
MNGRVVLKKRLIPPAALLAAACLLLAAGCGGGGGGGGVTTTPTPSANPQFLLVSNPDADGKIYTTQTITVTGQTTPGSTVTVNGAAASVDSAGNFSYAGLAVTANPFTVTVKASGTSTSISVPRTVYYHNQSVCTLVYAAEDPRTGVSKIFETDPAVDPDVSGSARVITNDDPLATDTRPAVSPDRSSVAFIRSVNGSQNIYTTSCTGTAAATRITNTSNVFYESVSWSKSGAWLAYSANASLANDYDVFVIPASAGQSYSQVTTHMAADTGPSWTPDNRIVFASNRPLDGSPGSTISQTHLWAAADPFDPNGPKTLLYAPDSPSAPSCSAGAGKCSSSNPDVSAAGITAFQFAYPCSTQGGGGDPPAPSGDTCYHIYYLPGGATFPSALTSATGYYVHPRWKEGASSLVFIVRSSGVDNFYSSTFTGSVPGASAALDIEGYTPDW